MATDKTVMAVIRASRPTFRNPHDKVAFAVHASCIASGFVLLATGPSAFSDDPFSSAFADEVGIDHWNDFEDTYGFIYSTPEGNSKKVLIKCIVMNGKLLVDALWEGASAPCHLELNVHDYVENGGANYDSQYKNFGKLVEEINKEILSKGSPAVESSSSEKGGIRDTADRRGAEFDDPYQHSGSIPPGYVVPPIPAFGGSDIFPGPGAGVYPTRDIGGYGGMLVGPRDRRFFPGIGGDPRLPGGFQGIPPPGARFDPFGPPDVPGFEPGRFIRDPTRPGSGRNHPDLEHFGGGSDFI